MALKYSKLSHYCTSIWMMTIIHINLNDSIYCLFKPLFSLIPLLKVKYQFKYHIKIYTLIVLNFHFNTPLSLRFDLFWVKSFNSISIINSIQALIHNTNKVIMWHPYKLHSNTSRQDFYILFSHNFFTNSSRD